VRWRTGEAGSERVGRTAARRLGGQMNRQKIERMDGPLALDGRRLMGGHINQPKVIVDGEGGVGEDQPVYWPIFAIIAGIAIPLTDVFFQP
jgi:hypothetical protein